MFTYILWPNRYIDINPNAADVYKELLSPNGFTNAFIQTGALKISNKVFCVILQNYLASLKRFLQDQAVFFNPIEYWAHLKSTFLVNTTCVASFLEFRNNKIGFQLGLDGIWGHPEFLGPNINLSKILYWICILETHSWGHPECWWPNVYKH